MGDKEELPEQAPEQEKPHFDISSYVVKQLGDELVSDEVTALMELVKNSYDADADYVNIVISSAGVLENYPLNYLTHKGYIVIEDNGDGMTKKEIEHGWLTISVSKKRKMKIEGKTTLKQRTPLGEKGLGRLSTQRLANKLELFTHNTSEESGYHLYFDWLDFTEDTLLSQIDVEIQPISKKQVPKGTRLILLDLKDKLVWQGTNVDKIKGKLSQLIFPKKRKRKFSVHLTIDGKPIDLDFVSEHVKHLAISRYAFSYFNEKLVLLGQIGLAKLRGNDRENYAHLIEADEGKSFYDFISDKSNKKNYIPGLVYQGMNGTFVEFKKQIELGAISNLVYHEEEQNTAEPNASELILKMSSTFEGVPDLPTRKLYNPGNFRGRLDEYAFNRDLDISSLDDLFKEFDQYTSYVQSQTGIRIFRDGFGLRPFGLDGEDWLKLSEGQTSGSSYYGLRPKNIIGYIEISAQHNPALHEKTDREGIIDNAFFKNFYRVNKKVIEEINDLLEDIKRAYNNYRKAYGISNSGVKNQVDAFKLMRKTSGDSVKLLEDATTLKTDISESTEKLRQELKRINNEPLFSNEQEKSLMPLLQNLEMQFQKANNLITDLQGLLNQASKLNNVVHVLEPQIKTLQEQLSEFSHLAGVGMIAESLAHEIDNILDNLIQKSNKHHRYLKEKKYDDFKVFEFVDEINKTVASLRKQVSHLSPSLRFVREEKEVLSIEDFVKELQMFYCDRLKNSNISLQIDCKQNFKVSINKGKLTQILDNLILNSEYWVKEFNKQTSKEGIIAISISQPFVQLSDNGFGIDPEIEGRIFQPFTTTKPKTVGRGLGLFISEQLLENYGCDIVLLPSKNIHGNRYIFQINFSKIIV